MSDANCCFSIVNIGAEGRRSDAGVFASSDLARLLRTNSLQLPPDRHLDSSGFKFPYVLVGDEAFPLTSYMMRPYPRSGNLTVTKKIFNYRLSRARRNCRMFIWDTSGKVANFSSANYRSRFNG